MNQLLGLKTIKEIAVECRVLESRVRYMITSRGLRPARTVGMTQLYSPKSVARIKKKLEAADVLRAE